MVFFGPCACERSTNQEFNQRGGEEEEKEAIAQTDRLDDVNAKKIDRFFSQRKIPVIGILLSDLGF